MKYILLLLPFAALAQTEVTINHQGEDLTFIVDNPLSNAVDLSEYHEYYQQIPEPYYNFDFNGDGFVNAPDMNSLLSHYGAILTTQTLLEMMNTFGRPPGYFDRLRIELFTLQFVYSSGTIAFLEPSWDQFAFNDRVVYLPDPEDDIIIQYTANDEEASIFNCEGFAICPDTFTLLLFTFVDGQSVVEKHYYAKR